jgi:putative heme transporter
MTEPARGWWLRIARVVRALASAAVALALLLFALPSLTGAEWTDISGVLGRLTAGQIAALTLVWALGLAGYTWVLTGGLPGLTHAQALTLNLSSSSVSNLVPFGGALGVAVSYAMARSWGFGAAAFALMTLVTGIWNVMAKLALPVVALFALLLLGEVNDGRLALGAGVAAVALGVVVLALVGALSSERVAVVVGRLADRVARWAALVMHRIGRRRARSRATRHGVAPGGEEEADGGEGVPGDADGEAGGGSRHRMEQEVLALRHRTVGLVRGRWHHLTFGMVAFLGAQAVLQWLCLRMLGSDLSPVQVFAGFAFGRLLTSLVVTPGGVGISETGAAALLVNAFGGDPAVTASGVLLFSGYAYFLEIWAGGLGYAMWVLRRSWRRPEGRMDS